MSQHIIQRHTRKQPWRGQRTPSTCTHQGPAATSPGQLKKHTLLSPYCSQRGQSQAPGDIRRDTRTAARRVPGVSSTESQRAPLPALPGRLTHSAGQNQGEHREQKAQAVGREAWGEDLLPLGGTRGVSIGKHIGSHTPCDTAVSTTHSAPTTRLSPSRGIPVAW